MKMFALRVLGAAAVLALVSGSAFAGGDAAKGEKVAKKCFACHTFDNGGKNKVGPNLFGIIGRQVGTHEGYKYSSDYTDKNFKWSEAEIRQYLPDPKKFIGGKSKMPPQKLKDGEVDDLLAYLETLK